MPAPASTHNNERKAWLDQQNILKPNLLVAATKFLVVMTKCLAVVTKCLVVVTKILVFTSKEMVEYIST